MPEPKDWTVHFEAFDGSGLRQAEYCRREGLNPKLFSGRLSVYRQLRDRAVLVPVTVAGEDGGSGTKAEAPKIVLHCGQGRRLEMPLSVSPQWLSSLLKGL